MNIVHLYFRQIKVMMPWSSPAYGYWIPGGLKQENIYHFQDIRVLYFIVDTMFTVIFRITLQCIVLFCFVLYYNVMYHIVMYCGLTYYMILQHTL